MVKMISRFLHYSDNLIHIDLGGMNFLQNEVEYILKRGLRKSRTLWSCHFVGANLSPKGLADLLKILKI